jgi:hypothetical protein
MVPCAAPSGYEVRSATLADTAEIVNLLNQTFRTPIDTATWLWYTRENPLGPSRVYVAMEPDGSGIAGVIAFAPNGLRLSGARTTATYAHHLAYKPVHRNTVSYFALCGHALREEARYGVKLTIGPPNKRAYPIHKVLGKWVDFGALDCLRKLRPLADAHDCEKESSFGAEYDDFYARVSTDLNFCVEKDAKWVNWRFFGRPGAPYTVYSAREEGRLAGYIVLKSWQDPDGYRKAHILDLHALTDSALRRLISAAECYASGFDELNLWAVQGYVYRAQLEELGFAPGPVRQPLLCRTLDGSVIAYPTGAASLCYGDGDTQY